MTGPSCTQRHRCAIANVLPSPGCACWCYQCYQYRPSSTQTNSMKYHRTLQWRAPVCRPCIRVLHSHVDAPASRQVATAATSRQLWGHWPAVNQLLLPLLPFTRMNVATPAPIIPAVSSRGFHGPLPLLLFSAFAACHAQLSTALFCTRTCTMQQTGTQVCGCFLTSCAVCIKPPLAWLQAQCRFCVGGRADMSMINDTALHGH